MSSTSKSLSSLIKSDNPETISHTDFQSHFSKFKENEFEGRIDPKTDVIKLNDAYWLEDEPLRKYSSKRQYQRHLRKEEEEEGVTNALQDSGTNANVTNRKTVTRLNLQNTHVRSTRYSSLRTRYYRPLFGIRIFRPHYWPSICNR